MGLASSIPFGLMRLAIAAILVSAMLVGTAQAAERERPRLDYPGLRTGHLHFAKAGSVVLDTGFEFLPSISNEVAGIEGDLLRAPTLGLRYGLSRRAVFRLDWSAFNRLAITSRQDPAPLGGDLGDVTTDVGDLVIATLIRVQGERGWRPSWGIRFAARLPNTNEKRGIGFNSTDVFASALAGKTFGDALEIHADVGIGILTETNASFTQNDVLTYGLLADYWPGGRLHWVAEVVGFHSTHDSGPRADSSGDLRIGWIRRQGALDAAVLLTRGLLPSDSQGVGVAAHLSFHFTLFGDGGTDTVDG